MIEEVVEAPENLLKPENLSGKLILGKAQLWPKLWVKNWGLYANLNIFSKVMSIDQMSEMMGGKKCGSSSGDYLAWGESEWSFLGGVTRANVEEEDLCRGESKIHIFDQNVEKNIDCQRLCFNQHKKGRMAPIETKNTFEQLVAKQKEIQKVNPEQTWWVSVSGEDGWMSRSDGWVDPYTGNLIPEFVWQPGNPKPNEALTCGILGADSHVGNEQCIKTGGRGGFYCPCFFEQRPYLTLRGLCIDSNIDLLYLPRNNPADGTISYYGMVRSFGHFAEEQWRIETSFPNTTATTFAANDGFMMGKHDWTIEGDSVKCSNGKTHARKLKLTGCVEGEFTCDDGQCIGMKKRCDQVFDCWDESDEVGCKILVLKKSYRKSSPPVVSVWKKHDRQVFPATIRVNITLLDIASIRERDNEIDIKFTAEFEWFEPRAKYYNLKENKTQNPLEMEDIKSLWIPKLVYRNNKNNDDTIAALKKSQVYVNKRGGFTTSPLTSMDEIEIFEGKENPLTMIQSYTKDFKCVFDMSTFPFDTQVRHRLD